MLSQKTEILKRTLNDPWLSLSKLGSLNREHWVWIRSKSFEEAFETSVCKSSLDKYGADTFILMFKLLNLDTQISLRSLHSFTTLFGYLIRVVGKLFLFFFLLNCTASKGVAKLLLSYLLFFLIYFYVTGGWELCICDLLIDLFTKSCLYYCKSFRNCGRSHYLRFKQKIIITLLQTNHHFLALIFSVFAQSRFSSYSRCTRHSREQTQLLRL